MQTSSPLAAHRARYRAAMRALVGTTRLVRAHLDASVGWRTKGMDGLLLRAFEHRSVRLRRGGDWPTWLWMVSTAASQDHGNDRTLEPWFSVRSRIRGSPGGRIVHGSYHGIKNVPSSFPK